MDSAVQRVVAARFPVIECGDGVLCQWWVVGMSLTVAVVLRRVCGSHGCWSFAG